MRSGFKAWLEHWRKRLDYEWHWRRWKRANPQGTRAVFYALDAPRRAAKGHGNGPRTLGLNVEQHLREPRARRLRDALVAIGLQPPHRLVDFGCGSLWIGEHFMRFLEPGNYIGLDVVDRYYLERLPLLPAGLVEEKRPHLAVISPPALAEVAARRPDFLIATAVLLHVRPRDLRSFLADVLAAGGPETRILIEQRWTRRTRSIDGSKWAHGHRHLRRVADKLGCEVLWPRAPGHPLKEVRLFELRRRPGVSAP